MYNNDPVPETQNMELDNCEPTLGTQHMDIDNHGAVPNSQETLPNTKLTAVLHVTRGESSPMRNNTHPGGPQNGTPEMPHTQALSNGNESTKTILLPSLTQTQNLSSLPLFYQLPYLALTLQTGFGTTRKTQPKNLVTSVPTTPFLDTTMSSRTS